MFVWAPKQYAPTMHVEHTCEMSEQEHKRQMIHKNSILTQCDFQKPILNQVLLRVVAAKVLRDKTNNYDNYYQHGDT